MALDPTEDVPQSAPGCSFSQRLFSEEVAIAAAKEGQALLNTDPGYEFSNGRRFDTGPGATSGN